MDNMENTNNIDKFANQILGLKKLIKEYDMLVNGAIFEIYEHKKIEQQKKIEQYETNINGLFLEIHRDLRGKTYYVKNQEEKDLINQQIANEKELMKLKREELKQLRTEYYLIRSNVIEKKKKFLKKTYSIINPKATKSEIESQIAKGYVNFLQMENTEYMRIKEMNENILQLEQSLRELNQLYIDMQILVNVQSETLVIISDNVDRTVSYTEAGIQNLTKAVRYKKNYRKKLCVVICCLLVLLIITIIVVFVIIVKK